jgi:hypothetical protein
MIPTRLCGKEFCEWVERAEALGTSSYVPFFPLMRMRLRLHSICCVVCPRVGGE